jgi:hypothetical protein
MKPKKDWFVVFPSGDRTAVKAHTKSEARGMMKRRLGLRPKDSLPLGTVVERIG